MEVQGGEDEPVKHEVIHTPKKDEPDNVHHIIEVSPEAKGKAEENVKTVFNINHGGADDENGKGKNGKKGEKTAAELKAEAEKHARSPVESIQNVVKMKQEEARTILKQKEQEAKEMIDRIVNDRKKFEEDNEKEREKILARRPPTKAAAAAAKPGPKNSRELRN